MKGGLGLLAAHSFMFHLLIRLSLKRMSGSFCVAGPALGAVGHK